MNVIFMNSKYTFFKNRVIAIKKISNLELHNCFKKQTASLLNIFRECCFIKTVLLIHAQHDPELQQLLSCDEAPFVETDIPPEMTLRTDCPVIGCSDMGLSFILCFISKRIGFSFEVLGTVS